LEINQGYTGAYTRFGGFPLHSWAPTAISIFRTAFLRSHTQICSCPRHKGM